jgi:hypothetical protein
MERGPSLIEKIGVNPLGTLVGVLCGGLLGIVAGLAAGPVGSLLLAVGGALVGGALAASASAGTETDVAPHDNYWREHHASRPYAPAGADYADYGPAYRHGSRAYLRAPHPGTWQDTEAQLARDWDAARGKSRLSWEEARPAVRDAWERLQKPPG